MTQKQSKRISKQMGISWHFMAFPIWTYLNHGECGIPWQGLVSRKRQGGLEHLQVPGTKFLWKDKDLHQAARRSAPAPFVEPSSIIFLIFFNQTSCLAIVENLSTEAIELLMQLLHSLIADAYDIVRAFQNQNLKRTKVIWRNLKEPRKEEKEDDTKLCHPPRI